MKNIKIMRLCLENFKCHKALELDLSGRDASIYGDNATGKTSIYDALCWLLFGKDSHGNGEKNIEIKPLTSLGEVAAHDAVTSVEAVLLVDGDTVTLKRTLKEVWSVRRGCGEASYDGNTSEYYVDGVPCKKTAFAEKVSELADEDTFKLLTNVSHFAEGISWQERRAALFRVAGVPDDLHIMGTDDSFLPLIDAMGRLTLDDYKKKLLAEKKGYVGAKSEIPARISECERTIADISSLDFDGAVSEIERLSVLRDALESQLVRVENDTAASAKRVEIRAAQVELEALENENRVFRASQSAGSPDIGRLRRELESHDAWLKTKRGRLSALEGSLGSLDKDIASSRERWIAVNAEAFTCGICPTCGQALPEDKLKSAMDIFEEKKKRRLREIEQTANVQKGAKKQAEADIAELGSEIAKLEAESLRREAEISAAEASVIEPSDMPDYQARKADINKKIDSLSGELADILSSSSAVRIGLQEQIATVKAHISTQMEILGRQSVLEYSQKRIEELREDAKNASDRLESVERMLSLIDDYSRYKTRFVEDSVNGLFRMARFRLFRDQANGGIEDRCDVTYNGIPYINLNNGARINVGIDIINTLSRSYGVSVPLFVDNAESVTNIEPSEAQIIRLVVSENDKELRVNYED